MAEKERQKAMARFVRVTDQEGNEYVCRIGDLKKFEDLTEAEKAACFGVPQHGPGE